MKSEVAAALLIIVKVPVALTAQSFRGALPSIATSEVKYSNPTEIAAVVEEQSTVECITNDKS